MNREQVIKRARAAGLVVEPCASPGLIALRAGEAPEGTNERMRMTADGGVFTVADGYYWQVGTVEDIANYVDTLTSYGGTE